MLGSIFKSPVIRLKLFTSIQFYKTNVKFMSSLQTRLAVPFHDIRSTLTGFHNTTDSLIGEPVFESQDGDILNEGILVDSVKRKRKKMMKKHKLRKRRKSAKAERRKKNQGN